MAKKGLGAYKEQPGNVVGSRAAYVRSLVRSAETLIDFEHTVEQLFEDDVYVHGLSIKLPDDDRPEYLAVVRVSIGGTKKVGFHNALTFGDVVVGVVARLKNRSFKWKDDEYE